MIKKVSGAFIFSALIFFGTTMGTSAFAEGIKVGVILPLTGKLARFGEIERKSFLMAAEKVNEAGGINGENIELIMEDTHGKTGIGRSAIEKLIFQDEVCVVGGGFSSNVTWAAAGVAQKNKIPFLVNTASADKITEKGGDYIFRLNPPVSEYPLALSSFLTDVARVKTVAILYENTRFGHSRLKEMVRLFKKTGLKVVAKERYGEGMVDFEHLLTGISAKKPDLFYMISSSTGADASMAVRQARELNLNAKLFVGGGVGFTLSEFQQKAGIASNCVFAGTLWSPSVQYPGASDYYNEFVAKYNEPTDYHGAQAYAAMHVIADALKRAKSHTPHDVRDALAETDILTVFGPVKFISYGKKKLQNKLPVFLGQWVNGKFEAVWPKELATVGYIYPLPSWGELNNIYQ
ncbi:MAG: ABC transporter substrate-binding protein [Deltaproteobacteria bacterium]|nr:ABC transporter substrate-binding protein [Deltaproteobacteria bacterium]